MNAGNGLEEGAQGQCVQTSAWLHNSAGSGVFTAAGCYVPRNLQGGKAAKRALTTMGCGVRPFLIHKRRMRTPRPWRQLGLLPQRSIVVVLGTTTQQGAFIPILQSELKGPARGHIAGK